MFRSKNSKPQKAEDNNDDDDDNISSSSISEASLRLDEAADKRLPLPLNGDGGGSSSGEDSFDLELGGANASTGSVDQDVLTDDEEELLDEEEGEISDDQFTMEDILADEKKGRVLQKNIRESIKEEQQQEIAPRELGRVRCMRMTVIWAFVLGTCATGALAYLYVSGTLFLPDETNDMEEWVVSLVLVGIWLVVAMVVAIFDLVVRRALNKLKKTASKNSAIVNSLFPENVRSRMLKEETRKIKRKQRLEKRRSSSGSRKGVFSSSTSIHSTTKSASVAGGGNASFSGMLSLGSLGSKEKRRQRRKERRQRRGGQHRSESLQSSPANETQVTAAGTETTLDSNLAMSPINSEDTIEDEDDGGLIPKDILKNKPIADFFPHCTVLFADIVGFTAWSSVRDPTAVFTLLESLYSCFDGIARRLNVFKVETIGDCYVAVTGLPEPQEDHAVRMAQFSRSCMSKMIQIVRALEKHLGPDTGDLSMRFGLHSGPVTAGVMRGEKSRFQLFGDTVNTAARIESTGMRDKVHLSESTAEQLKAAGKDHWVELRETKVQAKGKGKLQTYWLTMSSSPSTSAAAKTKEGSKSGNDSLTDNENSFGSIASGHRSFGGGVKGIVALFEKEEKLNKIGERTRRQADYTVEVLSKILRKIVAQRWGTNASLAPIHPTPIELQQFAAMESTLAAKQKLPLDEVNEAIDFWSMKHTKLGPCNGDRVKLPQNVSDQLADFVTTIASMYQGHSFHCWEHASHVTISLTKLHSRLVDPAKKQGAQGNSMAAHKQWKRKMPKGSAKNEGQAAIQSDDPAFGIPNDPMAEFALVFAAMIHDIDHSGHPNAKLVKENSDVTKKYGKKSPAEQHSLDVAWSVFQLPAYQQLRRFVYSNESEMGRFRQLVVTLVMATDILDRDLFKERHKRWERVFAKRAKIDADNFNQRATLVLETMIQASNIAHCTQHWNVYIKWNKKLFQEMCVLYTTGRQSGQKDPADFWYQGELTFFDDVVIPLANKLMESGAFGDDAEELLAYAKSNRRDWQAKGRDIVLEYLSEIRGGNGLKSSTHSTGMRASTRSTSSAMSSLWSSDGSLSFKPPSTHDGTPKWSKPSLGSSASNIHFSPVPR